MCGRFVGNFTVQSLLDELLEAEPGLSISVAADVPESVANFNTAPTQSCLVVRSSSDGVVVDRAHWGLVPSWAKDASSASKLINARSETVTEKPSFRGLVKGHRAIIPMTGFYEWDRSDPKNKRPYFVPREDGRTMWAAGLWAENKSLDGLRTFTMLTRESLDDLSGIHHRSPVQCDLGDALSWALEAEAPMGLVSLVNPPRFAPREVGRDVNAVRNNGPHLLDPVEPDTLF